MKNPFRKRHGPVESENPIEGPAAASGIPPRRMTPPEVGDQTEMLTRARRHHHEPGPADRAWTTGS